MGWWASDRWTPAAKSLYRSIFIDGDILPCLLWFLSFYGTMCCWCIVSCRIFFAKLYIRWCFRGSEYLLFCWTDFFFQFGGIYQKFLICHCWLISQNSVKISCLAVYDIQFFPQLWSLIVNFFKNIPVVYEHHLFWIASCMLYVFLLYSVCTYLCPSVRLYCIFFVRVCSTSVRRLMPCLLLFSDCLYVSLLALKVDNTENGGGSGRWQIFPIGLRLWRSRFIWYLNFLFPFTHIYFSGLYGPKTRRFFNK